MFFNFSFWFQSRVHRVFVGFLGLSLLLNVACSREGESFREPVVIPLDKGSTQCLSEVDRTLQIYAEGNISEAELKEFWTCLGDAVQMFLDLTRGRQSDTYSTREIQVFLEEYFLGEIRLSTAVVHEFMDIKRLFLGGSVDFVRRAELKRTQKFLQELESLTLLLRPHMSLVWPAFKGEGLEQKPSIEKIERADKALRYFAQGVFQLIPQETQFQYSFKSMNRFIDEVKKTIYPDYSDKDRKAVKQYIDLLASLKKLLVSPTDKIAAGDWKDLLGITAQALNLYLRYHYVIAEVGWNKKSGLDQVNELAEEVFDLLLRGMKRRERQYFQFDELVNLVDQLRNLGAVPEEFDKAVTSEAFRLALNRILRERPLEASSLPLSPNFTPSHLKYLQKEFGIWFRAQKYLERVVEGTVAEQSTSQQDEAIAEIRRAIESPWVLNSDSEGRLVFDYSVDNVNLDSLSTVNLMRVLVRGIIRGYATNEEAREELLGLTEEELKTAARELVSIGKAFYLFDGEEGAEDMASSVYFEGNLFMPRADGNDILSFEEGIEYFRLAISALNGSGVVFEEIAKTCGKYEDEAGDERIPILCFRSQMEAGLYKYIKNLPHLSSYIKSARGSVWPQMQEALELVTRDDIEADMSQGEILQLLDLLQYLETFFGRYDTDRSKTINLAESALGYPIFADLLQGFIGGDDEYVYAFYTFLFRYGNFYPELPWGGGLKWLNWYWHPDKWAYEADRLRVLGILANLVKFL